MNIQDLGDRRLIQVPPRQWTTAYPRELVEAIAAVKGPENLCDEIRRDEDPAYVEAHIVNEVLAYASRERFAGKRILDFGCGCGSSTMVLARLFPDSEIVAVELEARFLEVAAKRAEFHGYRNVRFTLSPDPMRLPDIPDVHFIVLSAVYEHLLPAERPALLRTLWSKLLPGGVLFVNQTPHRFWPIEGHTTGIPLLNYLPDKLAYKVARRWSRKDHSRDSWETMLRRGIRGGTASEIGRHLREAGPVTQLAPLAAKDEIELWYRISSRAHPSLAKAAARVLLRSLKRFGISLTPALSIAFCKSEKGGRLSGLQS